MDVSNEMLTTPDQNIGQNLGQSLGRVLLIDDDSPFVNRLARAMQKRGYVADVAESIAEANAKVDNDPPDFAVVDMRLGDGNGLDVIERIQTRKDDARVVVLTGYGNISTAVTAV